MMHTLVQFLDSKTGVIVFIIISSLNVILILTAFGMLIAGLYKTLKNKINYLYGELPFSKKYYSIILIICLVSVILTYVCCNYTLHILGIDRYRLIPQAWTNTQIMTGVYVVGFICYAKSILKLKELKNPSEEHYLREPHLITLLFMLPMTALIIFCLVQIIGFLFIV